MYGVTKEFYDEIYIGESVREEDFPSLLSRAVEIIETMSLYRLNEARYEGYAENVKVLVKKAICAQIEYIDANGGSELDTTIQNQSAGLGKFNYSAVAPAQLYSPRAQRILIPTGLIYRGGGSN